MIPPPLSSDVSNPSAYVYLLQSLKNGKHYIGWTTDLKRRVDAHNLGMSYWTSRYTPYQLIGFESFPSAEAAKDREKKLKNSSRMRSFFIKRLTNCASTPIGAKEVAG